MDFEELDKILDKTDKGQNKNSISNFVEIFRNDDNLKDAFHLNLFTNMINVIGDVPWEKRGERLDDNGLDQVKYYIDYHYGMNQEKNLISAMHVVADENSFHPIIDCLESLEWDGYDRLSEAMTIYLGAEKSDINTEFLTLFMLGAINRVYNPGCKYELTLNFTGAQGVGKSTFVRFLAIKDDWFCDDISNISDDKICRYLIGHWIIELSELVATANSKSIEATKAQISRQKDTYKIPYDRFAKDFPRQCVFAGTTNKHEFLPPDKSGNRRSLPVACNSEKQEKQILENEKESREYFRQMWAQAMHIFKTENPPLKLKAETEKYLKEYQANFTPEDYEEGMIQAWFETTDHKKICTLMIYNECLGKIDKPSQYILNDISEKVDHLIASGRITGFEKSLKTMRIDSGNYGVQRGWKKIKPPEYEQANMFDGPFGKGTLVNSD